MAQKFDFTDPDLEALAPAEQPYRVFDAGCSGLGLWVGPQGQKMFFVYWWPKGTPRPTEKKVGPFPQLSVDEARGRTGPLVAEMRGAAPPAAEETDEDALRFPGECKQCLDMTMLNARGLCAKCRPLPPCLTHPDTTSAARCSGCNRPFCEACLSSRRCEDCTAKAAKRRKGGAQPSQEVAGAGGLAALSGNRKLITAAVAGVLTLALGGILAWQYMDGQGPPATAEDTYGQRLAIVQSAIGSYKQEKKALPRDAAELAKYLKANGVAPITLSSSADALPKDAVVYVPKGNGFELFATTAEGTRFTPTRPASGAD